MRFVWTRKLSPNRQIGRISAILQDGVPRTIPLGVAWRRSLPRRGMSFCRGQSVSGQVTRTRILRVGLDLASAEGLCRITFGSVAGRASLSKGGVVAHFPHLDDLKRSILDVALDLWSRTCLGVDTGVGGGLPTLIRYVCQEGAKASCCMRDGG